MKKLMFILAMAFFMVGMVACDIIEEPYFKENNGGGQPGEEPAVKKYVLLEDYTGVKCVNCPPAGELALQLQEQHHHQVIVLSVHAGSLAEFPLFDLTTTEGDEWWKFLNFQENPSGTINRKMINGGYKYDSSMWSEAVAETLQEEAALEMTPSIEYNETTRELKVDIKSKFLTELPDPYSLTVCIMEDSIVGIQQTQEGIVKDYVHRHVFRTTMNGAWGEEINTTAIAPGEEFSHVYTKKLDSSFNEDQCYIIAYVANSDTKEVLQVIEKKIK